MADKKLWKLTITSEDTTHDDGWPWVTVLRATDEEMAALEKDLGGRLYSSNAIDSAPDVAAWREENADMFEGDEDD